MFSINRFQEAALAYERIIYTENPENQSTILLKKAWCYKALGDYQNAIQNLTRIDLTALEIDQQCLVMYETALVHYLNHQYPESLRALQRYPINNEHTAVTKDNISMLYILNYCNMQDWENAKTYYQKYSDTHTSIDTNLFNKKNIPKFKNPDRARKLSTFMPGVGQIYAGAWGAGLSSIGLQLFFLGYGAYNIYQGFYLTGFSSGLALWQALYFGGLQNAEFSTNKMNEQKKQKFIGKIKKELTY